MRENLMSGSRWQGMKTRHGVGTEALSEEMESNGSATPKSRRHPLTLPPDVWESAAFSSIFLASSFFCSQAESTPAHTLVTQTDGAAPLGVCLAQQGIYVARSKSNNRTI